MYRCNAAGDPVLSRHHTVCRHVRPDGSRAHLHDRRVRGGVSGRYLPRYHPHNPARALWNVFR